MDVIGKTQIFGKTGYAENKFWYAQIIPQGEKIIICHSVTYYEDTL